MKTITPQELSEKLKRTDEICILDVRSQEKYEDYHIKDANIQSINISKSLLFNLENDQAESISNLPKNKEIVVTCTTGNSARKCAAILSEKGYQVTLLEGGITSWKEFTEPN